MDKKMVNLTINGKAVTVPASATILDAARQLNINIPTLCHCEKLGGCGLSNNPASCRICVVEVEKRRNLAPACATPVMEGMVVHTNSQRALNARRTILELKYHTPDDEHIMGIEYYQAVIADGIRTYPEFMEWRKTHPANGIINWCP